MKSMLRKCVTCKLVHGKTVIAPKEPSLNQGLVLTKQAELIMLDQYFRFKNDTNVEMKKSYFLLITCRSTRAVHLEVTTDFNANSLLLALRRIFARKGTPNMKISDKFKAFKAQSVKIFCKVNS